MEIVLLIKLVSATASLIEIAGNEISVKADDITQTSQSTYSGAEF